MTGRARTRHTYGAERVLLDSSAFFRFCDGGQLLGLAGYLGARAFITREVAEELQFNSTRDPYRGLQTLARLRWPSDDHVLDLSPPLQLEVATIVRGLREPGDHDRKHLGEVATVLIAEELGGELVVMEDGDGKYLAGKRGVPRCSSAMLAAEMVVERAIDDASGYRVYKAAAPPEAGEADWRRALARATAEK